MDHQPDDRLPPKPEPPEPGDCCGSGCMPCVYDRYEDELEAWRQRVEAIKKRKAEP